jgi:glycosyltransferase involved in cell wall biosynthesis
MRILFFIRSLVVGGSQRQLVMLADGLARRGHQVSVAVFYTGHEIEAARRANAFRVVPLGKAGRWDVAGPLKRLRRLLREERPDVLYAFQPTQAALAALLVPKRRKLRLVFGIRAAAMQADRYDPLSALSYRLEAWLSRRADLIIANARAGRDDAIRRGMPGDRLAVVPNGIDTGAIRPDTAAGRAQRRAWGIADDAFVVGCVARFDPMKDHATFLRAAAQFASTHPHARFVCVGDGPPQAREDLRALAQSLGVAERLVWAGEMADVAAAYSAFDIATLSSAFGEGFPNVVAEAMACGIPVVATDVGDVRAIVDDLGAVVPPQRPDLLSEGWARLRTRLIETPGLRAAARESIVVRYGVDDMVDRTEAILTALCTGRPASAIVGDFT